MKAITIIGGGIAGLVTGIALRQRGVGVTVIEAGNYPRHKVCGEFLNGAGAALLEALEIPVGNLGMPVKTISFHQGRRSSQTSPLPDPGVAISRFSFDHALSKKFVALGGALKCGSRSDARNGEEGKVRATGRKLRRSSKWKWYGIKGHAQGVRQQADLEFHLVENGYIGICRLAGGRSNVCGLFRRAVQSRSRNVGLLEHFTIPISDRLFGVTWDEASVVAVSGLPVTETSESPEVFSVGDAFCMIPPFTGNGMSIAIELGLLGAGVLEEYARGERSWREASAAYGNASEELLQGRMRMANFSQKLLLIPLCQRVFMMTVDSTALWRKVFEATR